MDDSNSPASSTGCTTTLVLRPQETDGQVVHLKLKKPKNNRKQVSWDAETVDNEHLNKKKSKCCCIYTKPRKFGEADEDENKHSDDECDSCMGKKSTHQLHRPDGQKEEPKPEPDEDNDLS